MGFRPSTDYLGGNFAPVIDKMLGNAFWAVKAVADNVDQLRYVALNMASVVTAAQFLNSLPTVQPTVPGTVWFDGTSVKTYLG